MQLETLPVKFEPYKIVEIAKNKIIDGIALLTLNNYIPLLIGKGEQPEVWINIPSDSTGLQWQPLVRKNRSLHDDVTIKVSEFSVTVDTPDGTVLEVTSKTKNKAIITKLDLRPFGINMFIDKGVLKVSSTSFSGNTFKGSKVMIGMGG
jgi:hypothetical protein